MRDFKAAEPWPEVIRKTSADLHSSYVNLDIFTQQTACERYTATRVVDLMLSCENITYKFTDIDWILY